MMCLKKQDLSRRLRMMIHDHFARYMIIDNIKHIGIGNLILVWVHAYAST